MKRPRNSVSTQWLLPLEYQNTTVLSAQVREEAIRTLADLLLEAANLLAGNEPKGGANDERQD